MSRVADLTVAQGALKAGQLTEALAHVERALSETPEDLAALAFHAELLLRLERWEQSLSVSDRLLGFAPNDAWAYRLRCVALENLGRYDEEIASARKVLELEPQNANGYFLLGKALMQLGHDPQARAALEEAVRFEPLVPLYRVTLARLLFESTPAVAEALLERVVADEPNRAAELNDLGALKERKGDPKAAGALYQRALAADATLAAAKNNLERRKQLASAGIHYAAMVLFLAVLSGGPFAIGGALYHYGHGVLAGVAFTFATLLTVAAVVTVARSTRKRSEAMRRAPECSVR